MGFCRPIMRTARNERSQVAAAERLALLAALSVVLLGSFTCARAQGAQSAAVIHPQIWPQTRPDLPPDPALEGKVNALLAGMTVEQKVGQLIQGDITTLTPADLRPPPAASAPHRTATGSVSRNRTGRDFPSRCPLNAGRPNHPAPCDGINARPGSGSAPTNRAHAPAPAPEPDPAPSSGPRSTPQCRIEGSEGPEASSTSPTPPADNAINPASATALSIQH